MNDGYQVQINGMSGAWHAVTPETPHQPCDALHDGDYWHTSMSDAQAHARKVAEFRTVRAVRIVVRDRRGRITSTVPVV